MAEPLQHALTSVIIPCHNHAHFLGEAIDSALKQTYPHIEVIVVDDGSTDDIKAIISPYPGIRYVRQGNQGVSRARNVGLSQSRGTYVLFLDADDRLLPDAIAIGVRALSSHTDCAFTFGFYAWAGALQGIKELEPDFACTYTNLLTRNFIGNPGSVLYNRWVFQHVGGFDESNGPAADYDLYLRIARRFPIFCHRHPVVEYRRHVDNMSNNMRLMLRATMKVLRKQRRYVRTQPEMKAAYEIGLRHFRSFYGEPIIDSIHANLARRNLLRAVSEIFTLVRFCPGRLLSSGTNRIASIYATARDKLCARKHPSM
jgi:glycosyltransferase involved in cell wall biosynthesis